MILIDMDRLRKELMAKGDIPIHEVFNTIWEQPIVNVSQQRWIPVSEGLPKAGQRVLVADKCEAVTTALYFGKSPFWREMVVAWMPLPEPYKEDNNAEKDAEL